MDLGLKWRYINVGKIKSQITKFRYKRKMFRYVTKDTMIFIYCIRNGEEKTGEQWKCRINKESIEQAFVLSKGLKGEKGFPIIEPELLFVLYFFSPLIPRPWKKGARRDERKISLVLPNSILGLSVINKL